MLDFIEEYKFDRAGAFKYSKEEGTKAALLNDQIDEEVVEERLETLLNIQSEVSYEKNQTLLGKIQQGIIDSFNGDQVIARIASQAPEVDGVTFIENNPDVLVGDIINIKITNADIYDLHGKILEKKY